MIGVLAGGDVGQEARPGQTLVDDGDRRVADGDVIAALGTGVLETHMLVDEQTAGVIVELFADVFAELDADLVAARTDAFGFAERVFDADTLKILRQLLAAAAVAF